MNQDIRVAINEIIRQGQPEDWIAFLPSIETTADLGYLLGGYNWDDGFEVPTAIADHKSCDLGIALSLWWLGDGPSWFEKPEMAEGCMEDWGIFCRKMTDRITSGTFYTVFTSKCIVKREDSWREKLRKKGLPDVFFLGVD